MTASSRMLIEENLKRVPSGRLAVHTHLRHFALINYAVPAERLMPWIPEETFEIETFKVNGIEQGLISIIPFVDQDFHFKRAFPWAKFHFAQTNHRFYVRQKRTGRRAVWFLGTTLGSRWVVIPRHIWKLPWHYARYRMDFSYNDQDRAYQSYKIEIESSWCSASIDLEDSGEPIRMLEGFQNYDDMKLILTHPVDGFYNRKDGQIGGYSVWHREMDFTLARPKRLYFSIYEEMNILSRAEMARPHSAILCPHSEFIIEVPPKVVDRSQLNGE